MSIFIIFIYNQVDAMKMIMSIKSSESGKIRHNLSWAYNCYWRFHFFLRFISSLKGISILYENLYLLFIIIIF